MTAPDRATYVDMLRQWRRTAITQYDEQTRQWFDNLSKANAFAEVGTPGHPVTLAFVEAFLAVEDKDDALAESATQHMRTLRQFADRIPAEYIPDNAMYDSGQVPPQSNVFVLPYYCEAYGMLRHHPCLTAEDHETIGAIIADSVAPLFRFPEWGSHNRAMLRAWTLAAAAAVCPDRPERADWEQLGWQIAADSLTGWTVEDAASYHALWSRALIPYVDLSNRQAAFYREPTTRFYFEYNLNLLCPIGGLADFGDSDWAPSLQLYVAVFERAASAFRDPHYRWAAGEMYRRMQARVAPGAFFGDPCAWVHCAQWMDDTIQAQPPDWGSREVLEELAGKKVVFRSGWEPESTFLLLNYKPETDYGRTIRDYMRNTISVEAEKAHHGHSDENSISTLISDGVLLLHDGGYRERVPNGKYRADYYHARPVVRRGLLRQGESVYEFLHSDGHHRPMQTERIDFRTFREVEFSRTRASDTHTGYTHDRIVIYLKRLNWFVVVDAILFEQTGPYSVSNLFFTHEITASGTTQPSGSWPAGNWFDTRIGGMRGYEPANVDRRLLVSYIGRESAWQGSEPVQRYYRDEVLMHQSVSGRAVRGHRQVFCTALIPHAGTADPATLAASVSLAPVSRPVNFPGQAVALQVRHGQECVTLGIQLDLQAATRFADVRPRQDWDSGRTKYGDWETDANFFYGRQGSDGPHWAWTEATRLEFGGRELFQGPEGSFPLQYIEPSTRRAVSRWRAWESPQ
ncbi:MAG: hypothetical protein O2782_15825 [bacterium]|nr:hypothetical protein [bacterium]